MLYPIFVEPVESGFRAECPDVPGCVVTGSTLDRTLTAARLTLEANLAAALGRGEAAPEPSPARDEEPGWYTVHINLAHLQALARHQQGRWD